MGKIIAKGGYALKRIIILCIAVLLAFSACGAEETTDDESIDVFNYIQTVENLEDYIIIGTYKGVTVKEVTVNDADIAEYKAQVQNKYAYYKPITDKTVVSVGDNINISFVSYINGVAFDGGDGVDDIIVGDGEFVFPEVEAFLSGKKVGSTVSTTVTVPDDYFSQGLRGKNIELRITINKIQEKEKTTPEINDEFVSKHFGLEKAADFDAYARAQLEVEAENTMMEAAWKAALANCEIIRYPDNIINLYVDAMYAHYKAKAAEYDAGPEIFIGADTDAWRQEATAYAKDYYKSEIAMYAILDREFGREVSDSEYKTRLAAYAEEKGVTPEKLEKVHGKEDIITSIHWDKVMEVVWKNRIAE